MYPGLNRHHTGNPYPRLRGQGVRLGRRGQEPPIVGTRGHTPGRQLHHRPVPHGTHPVGESDPVGRGEAVRHLVSSRPALLVSYYCSKPHAAIVSRSSGMRVERLGPLGCFGAVMASSRSRKPTAPGRTLRRGLPIPSLVSRAIYFFAVAPLPRRLNRRINSDPYRRTTPTTLPMADLLWRDAAPGQHRGH